MIADEHPDAVVSISSDVLREYREYERSVTTLVDAAVKPNIRRYVANIAGHLDAMVSTSSTTGERTIPFYVMKSNGGVLSAERSCTSRSPPCCPGPRRGRSAPRWSPRPRASTGLSRCDGGGTSTDVTVVIDGHPALTTEGTVGAYPSKIPMIDVVTVGAGGGSIAWISPEGTLKVGPQSAGADPGPMCYGQGGDQPTITDAHVLLGRIPPHLLGGEVPLDLDLARGGVEDLAGKLGLSWERGGDRHPGDLRLEPGQRAAPDHGEAWTRRAGLPPRHVRWVGIAARLPAGRHPRARGVVVPLNPGNLSAYGLLTVDVRNDYVQTAVAKHAKLDLDGVAVHRR